MQQWGNTFFTPHNCWPNFLHSASFLPDFFPLKNQLHFGQTATNPSVQPAAGPPENYLAPTNPSSHDPRNVTRSRDVQVSLRIDTHRADVEVPPWVREVTGNLLRTRDKTGCSPRVRDETESSLWDM
ncbi:hypothetical protein NL676_025872 [Syzygium grande]|nr:hypothetical protein NL676_025872 [Syzygium grande]